MNAQRPLVSIVITCFNYGRFLAEAIESALNQTHQPIEVVVVDDGSSDETPAVAARYPVHFIRQHNQGVVAAANAGMSAARGEFVMRLDADDRLAPTYVEETLAPMLADRGIHFVYTEVSYFGAATGTYPVEDFDPETLAERNYIHVAALMRRTSFELAGRYCLAISRLRCEDWDLWLTFAEHGLKGHLVRKPLLLYRRHPHDSFGTLSFLKLAAIRRELRLVAHLQDHHQRLFAPALLLRRMLRLPRRLLLHHLTPRFAAMLIAFYGVMLVRDIWPPRRRLALQAGLG